MDLSPLDQVFIRLMTAIVVQDLLAEAAADGREGEAMADTKKILLRPEEAAQALSTSSSTTYRLIREGTLPAVKVGSELRIPLTAVEDFVEKQLPHKRR